jgi:hypothetical protein
MSGQGQLADEFIDRLVSHPLFRHVVHRLAACFAEITRCGELGMVDQAASPLGPRRHCAAVRRRVAHSEPGASVVGRRHLLSVAALAEELNRTTARPERCAKPAGNSVRSELLAELRLTAHGQRHG